MTSLEHIAKSGQKRRYLSSGLTLKIPTRLAGGRERAARLANYARIAQCAACRRKGGRPMSLAGDAIAVSMSIPTELENNGILPEPNLTQSVGRLPPGRLLRRMVDGKYAFLTLDVQYSRGNRRACGPIVEEGGDE